MRNRETRTVQHPAMLEVGQRADVLVWRQQVGLFRAYDDPRRVVYVGLPGMADAGAIVAVTITPGMVGQTIGVAVQPEFKAGRRGPTADQQRWADAVQQRSGVYRIVRSAQEMSDLVADVQAGRWR